MSGFLKFMVVIGLLMFTGCASRQKAVPVVPAAPPSPKPVRIEKPVPVVPQQIPEASVKTVRSADGFVVGEIIGVPASDSKFAKLQIGMKREQVENIIGQANKTDSRVTGKQYQPFYFGGDTQRTEAFYKNEGQLTYSNVQSDDEPDTLIRIIVNPDATGVK